MTHYMFVFNAGSLCDVGKLTLIQPFSGFPKQTLILCQWVFKEDIHFRPFL